MALQLLYVSPNFKNCLLNLPGHLACQEETKGDGRVDVGTRDAGGAVQEDEDHVTEHPRDADRGCPRCQLRWQILKFIKSP